MAPAEWTPVPHVSLSPLAARWYAQRITVRELREASIHARQQGRSRLADELDEVSAQMRHVLAASRTSDLGSAEVVVAEVESGLERPASLDTTRVAEMLDDCSTRWVRALIDRGDLTATRVRGTWQIDAASVEDYLNSRSSR